MENQVELDNERTELLKKFNNALPDLAASRSAVSDNVYRDGSLSTRVKRLMSLALALGAGCANCILAQTTAALAAGATREEVLETLSVVVAMRGNTGTAESLRVIKLLDDMGRL
jgi:AhpD family alkylhydroperoxidase